MYEGPSGERFTIYCANATGRRPRCAITSGDNTAAFYWVDDKIAYVVSGPADREQLEEVTKSVYEQVDKSGGEVVNNSVFRTRAAAVDPSAALGSGSRPQPRPMTGTYSISFRGS